MRLATCIALLATPVLLVHTAHGQAACTDLIGHGYIGVYADPEYTIPCEWISVFTPDTLYVVAKLAGQSALGISGAEFRLELGSASGYFFTWLPNPNAKGPRENN